MRQVRAYKSPLTHGGRRRRRWAEDRHPARGYGHRFFVHIDQSVGGWKYASNPELESLAIASEVYHGPAGKREEE